VAEELDERSSHEVRDGARARQRDVEDRQQRERQTYGDSEHQLTGDVSTTESWQTFEPQRRQQLLTVGVSHELHITSSSLSLSSSSAAASSAFLSTVKHNNNKNLQEVQLSQGGRATLSVIKYFVKSLKVIRNGIMQ